MPQPDDYAMMARALQLAERGLYTASPNPRVGCVIARDGRIVGEGFHEKAGEAHAEVAALKAAGAQAAGTTVYTTLEPCSHQGRTPPCIDALIEAKVRRVVAAMQDPNPKVAGSGFERLKRAGIEVESGVLEHEAREMNIGFVSRMTRGRPWIRLKIAASLDGKTALNNGASRWITDASARRDGHHWRARSCAVLTGMGTVRKDDPELNVREVETTRQPLRVIIDSKLQIPLTSRVLKGGGVLVASALHFPGLVKRLEKTGAQVALVPGDSGKVGLPQLMQELAQREINEVLVEAGMELNGALLKAGLVDELLVYFAPQLFGDTARGMFDLPELTDLSGRRELNITDLRKVGGAIRIVARLIEQSADGAPTPAGR